MLKFDVRSFRLSHIAILVSSLLSQLFAIAQPAKPTPDEQKAVKDANGFFVDQLESPYRSGELPVRVLATERLEKGKKYPVVYVLPVEAKDDAEFG